MKNKISITINDITYDFVEANVPELMCDECDLEDFCSKNRQVPYLCMTCASLSNKYCVFKKKM